ncbi:PREDICTED: L-type lectin-domain containing receptor kinase V.5 isoform X3 [Camelina sativa]|uniref:L-type lectin-domain containing receptor kinase V.5 isoform X1 n=1 Tax=Camelina sativa TaxID=90675 RepID=A0ABM1Q840_CAMSA|nr:PREDICTED: L-type lectin-domain containing receptor kinase V.5 isoform X1 [Camelina sativa]XP_019082930.1 PREDICTED: L-type lectin-domain containing receptor kinase V.5 isoform X3 [Camelina sativa]
MLRLCQAILALFFTLFYNSHGYFIPQGSVGIGYNGYFTLTNTTKHAYGQAFDSELYSIKNSSTGLLTSFSVNFFFAIVPEHNHQGSHGMAFVMSPTRGLPGASSDQYLGIFNETNNGNTSNHVIAIELDVHKDDEFGDIDDNHVGININGLRSIVSAPAGYYDDKDGNFRNLSLISRKVMRLSIVYSQPDQQLNVTLFPADISVPPKKPLLSLNRDLSPYLREKMYLGFTASTGSVGAIHYMMSWFVNGVVEYPRLEFSRIPILPRYPKKSSNRTKTVLAVCLTVSVIAAFAASWFGFVFYLRHKKVKEVLEEWEIQYGPHRFAYKELDNATKGFKEKQLLGKGGFGQVYRGTLPGSDVEIAVKRTSHDSRQGMSEFLAEISTIGRLRHPNLVRLLGYCRHKENLYLVYDFMPNGSLDKYLNRNENQERLTWEQRFKIIKDVATALLHLHQEWVQVIIHRDIKPANVLIDHEMNARLGDFGLAKLYDQGFDPETSKVAGTFGYIAPEFLRTGRATTSTDVYAFGLVMLEVVCGRRLIERRAAENEEYLVEWILELWENGKIFDAAEESIRQERNRGQLELVLKLGVLCSHQAASIRPAMSAVMRILNGVSQLPDNLLDVVRAEKFKGWPETSMEEILLDVNSLSTLELTDSFANHGR